MLNKIKVILKNSRQTVPFDPSKFNDSLAMQTEWNPLKGGGSSFQTHKLVQVDYSRLEFKSTIGAKIFSLLFLLVGVGVPLFIGIQSYEGTGSFFRSEMIYLTLFGLIFLAAGGWMLYTFTKPVIFDRTLGMYWKGWKAPKSYLAQNSVDEGSRIGNIHAIQILSEYIRGDKKSYYSYELNLILKDGSRMNVIDHGNPVKLREDAKILSEFLGVPIWDSTS